MNIWKSSIDSYLCHATVCVGVVAKMNVGSTGNSLEGQYESQYICLLMLHMMMKWTHTHTHTSWDLLLVL